MGRVCNSRFGVSRARSMSAASGSGKRVRKAHTQKADGAAKIKRTGKTHASSTQRGKTEALAIAKEGLEHLPKSAGISLKQVAQQMVRMLPVSMQDKLRFNFAEQHTNRGHHVFWQRHMCGGFVCRRRGLWWLILSQYFVRYL